MINKKWYILAGLVGGTWGALATILFREPESFIIGMLGACIVGLILARIYNDKLW